MAGNRAVSKKSKNKKMKKMSNNNGQTPNRIPSVAPLAMDTSRPQVSMSFKTPTHRGSEGRVTGIDYIGTFNSALAFSLNIFNLNPRIASVFPRLSGIATVWRRYYFRKLRFHLFGINAATQSGYTAMSSLVTDDLATLVTPSTEAQVLNMENLAIGRPWSYVVHTVNLGGLGLEWYTTDVTASSSEFGEAIGRAFLALPGTTLVADIKVQLYVEYDVEFCQRISSNLVIEPPPICQTNGGKITGNGSVSTSNLLGDSATVDPQSVGISVNSSGVVTFSSAGSYVIGYRFKLASQISSFPNPPISGITNYSKNGIDTANGNAYGYWTLDAISGATFGPVSAVGPTVEEPLILCIGQSPSGSLSLGDDLYMNKYPPIRVFNSKPIR